MEKLKMKSKDLSQEHIAEIKELFPDAVTEVKENGIIKLKVDFDVLKQELSDSLINDKQERYQMTWPDKSNSIILANTQTTNTLRPQVERSSNFFNTSNIYIEGDNLEALKILREPYLNKIKMIYMDPPYNTGSDFVYHDDFSIMQEDYLSKTQQIDSNGNSLVTNNETNGRFHTNWLNMVYPRLKIARDLLKDDGIIFISIDDNEVDNLRKMCDEVFGENNFVAQMIIEGTPKNDPKIISTAHEYCLAYVKNNIVASNSNWGIKNPLFDQILDIYRRLKPNYLEIDKQLKKFYQDNDLTDDNISNYKNADENGVFRIGPIDDPQGGGAKDIRINPNTGEELKTPNSGWRCNISTWNEWVKNGLILFPDSNDNLCSKKTYISSGQLDLLRALYKIQIRKDTDYLKRLFGTKVFSFPKPVSFIKTLIDASTKGNDIVLDPFSGSGTTAQAVNELNLERHESGSKDSIKYILVQIQESLLENQKHATGNREKQTCANAINYCNNHHLDLNICSIGEERIKLSSNDLANKSPLIAPSLDLGYRVFSIDSSNMKDVYYSPADIKPLLLDNMISNIKESRTSLDILIQSMLSLGLSLSSNIKTITINDKTCYIVNDNDLVACFDEDLSENLIEQLANMHPLYACFQDFSFGNDSISVNCEQIFKTVSPTTKIRVI
jgi:adenine-specific DNA-methyltransferase